jgi:glycine betaine/proline transport system ATP-binding protein
LEVCQLPLIQLNNLYKVFGPQPAEALSLAREGVATDEILKRTGHAVALRDVSLSIEAGETFVVMGLSGSGKSTLIRCLNRLIRATDGEVLVDGQDVLQLSAQELRNLRQKRMAMVFQRFGLLPHRNVLQNIAFGLETQGVPKAQREAKSQEWVETVGLKGWEQNYPDQLSGGMQQRVGIARALCNDPDILLMDEPFGALDPLIRRDMQNELLRLQSKLNKTIVFNTHDLDEALRLGDRIAILKDGRVVQIGTPEEILTHPADDYVADFTRDVNRSRVLTAHTVMIAPRAVTAARVGPRAALKLMADQGLSSIFVVDRNQRFQGLVSMDDAVTAAQKGIKDLQDLLITDIPTTSPDTLLADLIPVAAAHRYPIVVLDEQGVLVGIIPRVAVLAALAGVQEEVVPELASVLDQTS